MIVILNRHRPAATEALFVVLVLLFSLTKLWWEISKP
jgi:hypothetical protein